MAVKHKEYSFLHLVLDFCLVFATGGIWLVWMLVRFLRSV